MYIKGYDNLGNSLFKAQVNKRNGINYIIKNHIDRFVNLMVLYTSKGEQIKVVYDVNHGGIINYEK